ncbi:MAG: S58 family peptidase [Candidatus Latescibacteria bacterium]|nr:S58 family peptidase [bacterium]MBD3423208.1 S58 family peptidase [Candidatus Latescibacterota bacterium]
MMINWRGPHARKPEKVRARDIGISVGKFPTGGLNAITDVTGVKVGQRTIIEGDSIRTGVTAILPHPGNIYSDKVPAAIFVGNGFGKLSGISQVDELGNIETPIILTNTLSVGTGITAAVRYTLTLPGNHEVRTVNPVVGETNDGYLNDIRELRVSQQDVIEAIRSASGGEVEEGCVGAGTGTIAFGFKGGIGTSSRVVSISGGDKYKVGVLVQTNYSGRLRIDGVEINIDPSAPAEGRENEGSCMIIIATDAPLSPRNLKRLAARSLFGLARTGSFMSNGSGDYAIAFSTAYTIPDGSRYFKPPALLSNRSMSILFEAVIEAVEESVYNSLFMAESMRGYRGRMIRAIPVDQVISILNKRGQRAGSAN